MNNYQLSPKPASRTQELEPLAMLFFFLGAIDIYSSLQRKIRERREKDEDRLRRTNQGIILTGYAKVALLALIVTAIIEISLL